ncbi:MAG: GNAT family N-acetyltransferase [Alphaproteobacteria bacterium]|jgi:ribosomal protein S18 acetylase RimI-like enzyme
MTKDPPLIIWTSGADREVAETILRALPDWFGIEEALVGYVETSNVMPTATVWIDDQAVGFASMEQATPATCDIHVIGVLPQYHEQGIGRLLIQALAERATADGARFLTVKTLSSSHPDPFYGRTRRFYEAVGFAPLAELPEHWGPENPCLLMGKALR